MSDWQHWANELAVAFVSGHWSVTGLVRQASRLWGRRSEWQQVLARNILGYFGKTVPDGATLTAFIRDEPGFVRAWNERYSEPEGPRRDISWAQDTMTPAAAAAGWQVPPLNSAGQLADWLRVAPAELDWFAGCKGRARGARLGPLHHYAYHWLTGRRGKARLLEIPKARLKAIQRRLLHEILAGVPVHEAAHGYRCSRSVATYVAPHAGRRVVLHFDLRQFFPSVRAARIHALFRTVGYPPSVARLLTGLCTNAVPEQVLRSRPTPDGEIERRFLSSHLPQGAPTSPALANLCAYRLDCRLAGLARSALAAYTRYADDLVFSGDETLQRCRRRFHVHVCRIALEEGFEVHTRKSHFMNQAVRQQVAGVVLNVRPNIRRAEFDTLKAILTNCARGGPRGQNREDRPDFRSYLAGRIAYVGMINPTRGRRLRELFDRISWETEETVGD
jgi:hypothetical protein